MILKPATKIFLIFFFSFFFLLFNYKTALAEWPAGCVGKNGYWICSCDPTYCGSNCVCGDVATTSIHAVCKGPDSLGFYSCEKSPHTFNYLCCPNWSTEQFCDAIYYVHDCEITPPDEYGQGATCEIFGEAKIIPCHLWDVPGPPQCYTSGTSCAAQGGTCGNPSSCDGTLQTGLCPGGSDCVCCLPPSAPDCGATCLNHGTASVGWPDCSCTNQPPASGYERIGTWNSSDCPNCTGYRQVGCSCNDWVAGSCGAGSCSSSERRYTRTCTPSGCSSEVNCAYDASCSGPTPTNTPPPPPPSCTVALDPLSLSLNVGDSDLITANVSVQNGSVNQVNFSSSNPDVASIDPLSDGDSPYRTQVTGESQGSADVSASVSLSPSGSCSTADPVNIAVSAAGWFQTQGGTIHTEGNLSNDIPATAVDKNMSIAQDGFPGVISHQSTTEANFGEGYPSNDDASHWLAKSTYQGKNFGSWTFFEKKYAVEMETENFDSTLPGSDGIYYSGSDKTLQGSWNVPAGRWILVLVDGNITIPVDISVPEGSFLGIVSSGNISFTDAVSQVEGMFIANNSINTGSTDTQFQGEGFFAASQFVLSRDLGDIDNPITPAELFIFRPDFLINSYKDADYSLWWFDFKWEEIAP